MIKTSKASKAAARRPWVQQVTHLVNEELGHDQKVHSETEHFTRIAWQFPMVVKPESKVNYVARRLELVLNSLPSANLKERIKLEVQPIFSTAIDNIRVTITIFEHPVHRGK